MPANLVFRRKIWGARDNGIPPRSTPDICGSLSLMIVLLSEYNIYYVPTEKINVLLKS